MLEDYRKVLRLAGIHTDPRLLFSSAVLVAVVSALLSIVFGNALFFLVGIVLADLIVFFPYDQGIQRVRDFESNLADALKQISSTLQSGGTFEMAVQEVVSADYGELSRQFRYVLNDLRSGNTMDAALSRLCARVPSPILDRVVKIIVDAFHAGGGLAKVLNDVAEDVRQTNRLLQERRAKTTMQAMFLVVSSVILAPFIIGAAFGIMSFFTSMGRSFVGLAGMSAEDFAKSVSAISTLKTYLTLYVIIQSFIAAIMVSAIREGDFSSGLKLAPFFALVAYVVLQLTAWGVGSLLGT